MNIETEQSGYILNTGAEPVLELPGKPEALNVRASESALVVVDMQNAYSTIGGYLDRAGFDVSTTGPRQAFR